MWVSVGDWLMDVFMFVILSHVLSTVCSLKRGKVDGGVTSGVTARKAVGASSTVPYVQIPRRPKYRACVHFCGALACRFAVLGRPDGKPRKPASRRVQTTRPAADQDIR